MRKTSSAREWGCLACVIVASALLLSLIVVAVTP